MENRMSNRLGRWLRRHSLTLVAALGGAAGVAYAAGWHGKATETTTVVHVATPVSTELPRDTVQDVVQIALVLDTSGSMDGLINQARSHLWNMVDQMGRMTRVVNGKTRGVKVELALYEYGNDAIPSESGFIRQVQPFTGDLDKVSEKLHALFTNGGSEYAGQAITTAVTQLQWSSDPNAMKFVFVAGNEEFDQGPITALTAMNDAAAKDISVQLIFCGAKDETWERAAKLAHSDLMTIDQNQVATHIPAPQDDQILQLGQQLNNTYIAYGAEGGASMNRQQEADKSSAKLSKKVAIERAQLKSKASYDNRGWDLVDGTTARPKLLEETKDEYLPPEMRGKTLEEKKQIVAAKTKEREQLKAQIAKLEAERTAFIEAEKKKQNLGQEQSLETELMKTTKKIAAKKGYK
jgi:hypothetical protein